MVDLARNIKNGWTFTDVATHQPDMVLKCARNITALVNELHYKHRTEQCPPRVVCYFGGSGIGKTHQCIAWAKQRKMEYWIHPGTGKWFPDYKQQRVCILDELDKWCDQLTYAGTLKLLDKFPMFVETKGGEVKFNSEYIFICTSVAPSGWFKDKGGLDVPKEQLERRIHQCWTREEVNLPWRNVPMFRPIKYEPIDQHYEVISILDEQVIVEDDGWDQMLLYSPNWPDTDE